MNLLENTAAASQEQIPAKDRLLKTMVINYARAIRLPAPGAARSAAPGDKVPRIEQMYPLHWHRFNTMRILSNGDLFN